MGHLRQNVVAYLALFVALGGTSAYAANEWNSSNIQDETLTGADVKGRLGSSSAPAVNGTLTGSDISGQAANAANGTAFVDGSLTNADVKNGSLLGADLLNGTLTSADVADGTLTGWDIKDGFIGQVELADGAVNSAKAADNSLTGTDITDGSLTGFDIGDGFIGQVDLADGTVNSAKAADNSLTGTDIDESTLNMPPTTTATFAGNPSTVNLNNNDTFTLVASKNLSAGSWAIAATANTTSGTGLDDSISDVVCELRNGTGFIGGATDRRVRPEWEIIKRTLSMNGGAQVPAGGGNVSLWCKANGGFETVNYSQMMMIRLDGFS